MVFGRKRPLKDKTPIAKAFMLVVLLLTLGSASFVHAQFTLVTVFTGSYDQTTSYFSIPTNEWRITWNCTPSRPVNLFVIYVYPRGESTAYIGKIAAMGETDTNGVLYVHEGGKGYYLKIMAALVRDYRIKIEYTYTFSPSPSENTPTPTLTPSPFPSSTPLPIPTFSPIPTQVPTLEPMSTLTPNSFSDCVPYEIIALAIVLCLCALVYSRRRK